LKASACKPDKNLLDAFIKLLAGAIDAKSPYTGGHCQRVPALALMIARCRGQSGSSLQRLSPHRG
jgi:HD-GYP domain-containing protein (c-di-GMP phosphodiesterase class II)